MRWKKQAATVLRKCSSAEEISCVQSACLASSITNTVGVFTRGKENCRVMSTWMDQISPLAFMDFRFVHLHVDNMRVRPICRAFAMCNRHMDKWPRVHGCISSMVSFVYRPTVISGKDSSAGYAQQIKRELHKMASLTNLDRVHASFITIGNTFIETYISQEGLFVLFTSVD